MTEPGDRSGIVTALPRFARPERDWIHPESLASDEVWQAPLDLASANLQREIYILVWVITDLYKKL